MAPGAAPVAVRRRARFLDYGVVGAQHRGTSEQAAQRTAARAVLRRLKESQRAPRDTVWGWDAPAEPDETEPA
jgi:hypothetical protein